MARAAVLFFLLNIVATVFGEEEEQHIKAFECSTTLECHKGYFCAENHHCVECSAICPGEHCHVVCPEYTTQSVISQTNQSSIIEMIVSNLTGTSVNTPTSVAPTVPVDNSTDITHANSMNYLIVVVAVFCVFLLATLTILVVVVVCNNKRNNNNAQPVNSPYMLAPQYDPNAHDNPQHPLSSATSTLSGHGETTIGGNLNQPLNTSISGYESQGTSHDHSNRTSAADTIGIQSNSDVSRKHSDSLQLLSDSTRNVNGIRRTVSSDDATKSFGIKYSSVCDARSDGAFPSNPLHPGGTEAVSGGIQSVNLNLNEQNQPPPIINPQQGNANPPLAQGPSQNLSGVTSPRPFVPNDGNASAVNSN